MMDARGVCATTRFALLAGYDNVFAETVCEIAGPHAQDTHSHPFPVANPAILCHKPVLRRPADSRAAVATTRAGFSRDFLSEIRE